MKHSDDINELAAALAKAQGQFSNVKTSEKARITSDKSSYEYTYATLADVLDMIRQPMDAHGLSLSQFVETTPEALILTSLLAHSSGQWYKSEFAASYPRGDMRSVGSQVAYMRRYSITAMLNIATEDDDGDAVSGRDTQLRKPAPKAEPTPEPKPRDPFPAPKPVGEPQVAPTNGDATHWIKDDKKRAAFWARAAELGLTNVEVHKALGVEHIENFTGDIKAAGEKIYAYIHEREQAEQMAADLGGVVAK
jgi:hypothetical protein